MAEVRSAFYWRENMAERESDLIRKRTPEQTDAMRLRVRDLRKLGMSYLEIARRCEISKGYAVEICKGVRYQRGREETKRAQRKFNVFSDPAASGTSPQASSK